MKMEFVQKKQQCYFFAKTTCQFLQEKRDSKNKRTLMENRFCSAKTPMFIFLQNDELTFARKER